MDETRMKRQDNGGFMLAAIIVTCLIIWTVAVLFIAHNFTSL